MGATFSSRRRRGDPLRESGALPAAAVDDCMKAAATFIETLHCHGVHHLTVYSPRGVHRIAVAKISDELPQPVRGRLTARLPGL